MGMWPASEAEKDRLVALQAGGPGAIDNLFAEVPVLADAAAGVGPLSIFDNRGFRRQTPRKMDSLKELAGLVGSHFGIELATVSVPIHAYQVLVTLAWLGGTPTVAEIEAHAPGAPAGLVEDGTQSLERALLVERLPFGGLHLRPGVSTAVPTPGYRLTDSLQWLPTDALAEMLRANGMKPPARKAERLVALLTALRDPVVVRASLADLSPAAREIFERLLRYREATLDVAGLSYWSGYRPDRSKPFFELYQRGLAGINDSHCWIWVDVRAALDGGIYTEWHRPTDPPVLPTGPDHRSGVPAIVKVVDRLFTEMRANPLTALKTSGIGVQVVRSLAKKIGVPPGHVGLLLTLAIELRLVEAVVASTSGRGRNRQDHLVWKPSAAADNYSTLPPGTRHAIWVQAWRDALYLAPGDALPERFDRASMSMRGPVQRDGLLRLLGSLPSGHGVEEAALRQAVSDRLGGACIPIEVGTVLEAARALGLVTSTGPVALTTLGWKAVQPNRATEDTDAPEHASFVVQADHSVMAPPGLRADIEEKLEQVATLESSGGVQVYRISDRSIIAALDAGLDEDTIVRFLVDHSSVPVAPNVLRTVRDAASRHGRLRVGSSKSWVISDDPAIVAAAVGVKAAKLVSVTPTMAVSSLTEAELTAALRAKHLAPVSDAEQVTRLAQVAATESPALGGAGRPGVGPREVRFGSFILRDALMQEPEQRAAEARRLFEAPLPEPSTQQQLPILLSPGDPASLKDAIARMEAMLASGMNMDEIMGAMDDEGEFFDDDDDFEDDDDDY